MTAFAVMLLMASAAAWMVSTDMRAVPRAYLRFACALLAALAFAAAWSGALAQSVAFIVCALAPVTLAMAARPVAPALTTSIAASLGLAASLTGIAILALAPLLVSAVALLAVRSAKMAAASLALASGGACLVADDLPALLAFLSAAVLGIALALKEGGRRRAPQARAASDRRAPSAPVRTTPAR